MTKSELKRRLQRYRELSVEIEQLREEIRRVDEMTLGVRGVSMNGAGHGSGVSDPTFAAAARRITLIGRYEVMINRMLEEQAQIEKLLDRLEPRLRALMRYHYLDGLTWEEVCVRINYSWRHTHNLHSLALSKLLEGDTVSATS